MNIRDTYSVPESFVVFQGATLSASVKNKAVPGAMPYAGHEPHFIVKAEVRKDPRVRFGPDGEPAETLFTSVQVETEVVIIDPWPSAVYGKRKLVLQGQFGTPNQNPTGEEVHCLKELGAVFADLEDRKAQVTIVAYSVIVTKRMAGTAGSYVPALILDSTGSVLWANPDAVKRGVIAAPFGADQKITSLEPSATPAAPRLSTQKSPLGNLLETPGVPDWFTAKAEALRNLGTPAEMIVNSVLQARGRELHAQGKVASAEDGVNEARIEIASLAGAAAPAPAPAAPAKPTVPVPVPAMPKPAKAAAAPAAQPAKPSARTSADLLASRSKSGKSAKK